MLVRKKGESIMTLKEEAVEVLCKKAHDIFGIDPTTLGENTSFDDDLHCKSTNIVQFSAALEDEFDIEVPYMQLSASEGIKLHFGSNTYSYINLRKENSYINLVGTTADAGNFWFDLQGGLQITTPGKISLEATSSEGIALKSDKITLGTIEVSNNEISIGELKVKTKIQELEEKVNALQMSDVRKKNILGDSTAGLKEINALEVKNYTYKDDKNNTPHVGVIAQQLQKVFPNSVIEGNDGFLRIKTEEIFYAMVNSIKELCSKLQDLTAKISGLDKRITELETQNKMLLEQNKAFEKRLEKLEKSSK